MAPVTRRAFLTDVGKGMVIAAVGSHLAADLGLGGKALADEGGAIGFGDMEPLVGLMQETPADKLLPILVAKIKAGTELRTLVAAGALANARTFGGEDYVGFHTMMALSPAYRMSRELPEKEAALPVLKVLYRNSTRLGEVGGKSAEKLHQVAPGKLEIDRPAGEQLREAVRRKDLDAAERTFAASAANGTPEEMFNDLLFAVEDTTEVHRIVMPYRAWDLLDLVGRDRAHTMLRQSVRYCVQQEGRMGGRWAEPRTVLPKVMDEFKFPGRELGNRPADDAFVEKLSMTIFNSAPEEAARAVASVLAEGFSPDIVGEAISLAANQLVLRDMGRPVSQESAGKPPGSIHGDSIGVHASDSANAWRNMARVGNARNKVACLVLGAYQVALDRDARGGDFKNWAPVPVKWHSDNVKGTTPEALIKETEDAIRLNLQGHAAAAVHRYGQLGFSERPVFDLMLKYATSEDGALHAEKYYRTTSEEFAASRPAFRWRQLLALARVTASEFGRPAPGVAEARKILNA